MKQKTFVFLIVALFLVVIGALEWLLLFGQNHASDPVTRTNIPTLQTYTISPQSTLGLATLTAPVIVAADPTLVPTIVNTATPGTITPTPVVGSVLETFENNPQEWKVVKNIAGSGQLNQSQVEKFDGKSAALLSTGGIESTASLAAKGFSDSAAAHPWGERRGTWAWQRAMVYLPSTTLQDLGTQGYLDLAGFWPDSGGDYGWWLRVRQNSQGKASLSVFGYDANGGLAEFNIYGLFPLDQWVDLTIGLNSQNGPGVKRAFAVLIDGNFYGWYHQGHMDSENYNQAAIGIVRTNVSAPLRVYLDQWYTLSEKPFPPSPDNRSDANLQTLDFRAASGVQWQIDWSTWKNDLHLDPVHGLFSSNDRLQSGMNLDRMPDLANGWSQIEFDWPKGTPPDNSSLTGSFAGLIGFHKEINREQNLEVSPVIVDGSASLVYDAWTGDATVLASWPLPKSSLLDDGRNIPEPGDILRIRWEVVGPNSINLRASYYDASTLTWYPDVINDTREITSIPSMDPSLADNVNFLDDNHRAASITIDTPFYSIRNFTVGTLDTYPTP